MFALTRFLHRFAMVFKNGCKWLSSTLFQEDDLNMVSCDVGWCRISCCSVWALISYWALGFSGPLPVPSENMALGQVLLGKHAPKATSLVLPGSQLQIEVKITDMPSAMTPKPKPG